MALIKCSECGKEISSKATACPNCGYPIRQTKRKHLFKSILLVGILLSIIIVIVLLFPKIENKKVERMLKETDKNIQLIKNCIGDVDDGYNEEMVLFGLEGTITYSNTLPSFIDYTNTATWNPGLGENVEHLYDNMKLLYGEPNETGGSHWRWQEDGDGYRIVLQQGDLGMKIIVQKERE